MAVWVDSWEEPYILIGARFYDPEIGVWFSTDAASQYWNLYGYPTNPVMIVDPDGNFALQAAIVSAIIGAGIGTVQGIINAHNQNGNAWDYIRETVLWSNVHGAIGFASGGVGGGIASNIKSGVSGIGGAIAAGAASGAVGGAMSYTGNYAANFAYSGFDQSYLDAGQYFGGLGKSVLIGGAAGGAMGALTYTGQWLRNNYGSGSNLEGTVASADGDVPTSPDGTIKGSPTEKELYDKFMKLKSTSPYKDGETIGTYKVRTKFFSGDKYLAKTWSRHYPGTGGRVFIPKGTDFMIHSHPSYGNAFPSSFDYSTALDASRAYNTLSYLVGPQNKMYYYSGDAGLYWDISF